MLVIQKLTNGLKYNSDLVTTNTKHLFKYIRKKILLYCMLRKFANNYGIIETNYY